MRKLIILVFGLSILTIGLFGGFYLALYLQGQTTLLAGGAILFAFLTWLGSGSDFMGMLLDWVRRNREEEKVPILDVKGFFYDSTKTYWIRLKKVRGEGFVTGCEGNISIEGTTVGVIATAWEHEGLRTYNISDQMDLRLFTIRENDSGLGQKAIVFPIVSDKKLLSDAYGNPKPFATYASKTLRISIVATGGNTPKDTVVKISDIIDQAQLKTG